MGKVAKKEYEILTNTKWVNITAFDTVHYTGVIWYRKVMSVARFTYADEVFYITPLNNGYVATHEKTGRAVFTDKPQKGIDKAYHYAKKILDDNCEKFGNILRHTPIPEENLSLDLALKNLL